MFTSIINSVNGSITIESLIICSVVSILLGFIISIFYMLNGKYTKNFAVTLVLLPVLVQMVIMIVNGNLGTGVAVLGTFSLVRFRSVPGSSKEIVSIFFAMAVGLAMGMGQIFFAGILVILIVCTMFLLEHSSFGKQNIKNRSLKVTIPESLDYTEIFDDLFANYTAHVSLERVKTTNLGSMLELDYELQLKQPNKEKEFLDAIRCRNGNLTIICSKSMPVTMEL